jgi:hypothetical protein
MSKWLSHVKKTMKQMKGEKASMGKKWFSHVLKSAKKTYKKHKGGEDDPNPVSSKPVNSDPSDPDEDPAALSGGKKRRRGGKTQRRRK